MEIQYNVGFLHKKIVINVVAYFFCFENLNIEFVEKKLIFFEYLWFFFNIIMEI